MGKCHIARGQEVILSVQQKLMEVTSVIDYFCQGIGQVELLEVQV